MNNKICCPKCESKDLTYNGYAWAYFSKGIHTFTKKVNGKFAIVECEEIQLTNGDIEFMTANEITLSPERIKKIKNKYGKSN